MKSFFLLLLALIIFSNLKSQNKSDIICEYLTDGSGKSQGLKIKVFYPCEYEINDGERPHIVKKFSTQKGQINIMLTINKLPQRLSEKEAKLLLSDESLKDMGNDLGTVLSVRRTNIDGFTSGEILFDAINNKPVGNIYSKNLLYFFIYDKYYIQLTYSCLGLENKKLAEENFTKFSLGFKGLASKTIVLNQW